MLLFVKLVRKMHSSFSEWKKAQKGDTGASGGTPRSNLASSRFTVEPRKETVSGVYSYNQMKRLDKGPSVRPPSVIGSIRSIRSVLTVEEQVTELEKKVDLLIEAQHEAAEREKVTQLLLAQIAKQLQEVRPASSEPVQK